MKIGVLTTRLFAEPSSGGEHCTARLLQALRQQGHRLHVLGLGEAPPSQRGIRYGSLGPAPQPFGLWSWPERGVHLAHALWSLQASTTLRAQGDHAARVLVSKTLARWSREGIDALIVDHLHAFTWLAQASAPLPRPVLVMHNLESQAYAHQAERERGVKRWFLQREHRLVQGLEQEALAASAAVLGLSEPDCKQLEAAARAAGSHAPVLNLPGYPGRASRLRAGDRSTLQATTRTTTRATTSTTPNGNAQWAKPAGQELTHRAHRVGLIGTWTWEPNRRALEWMLREVLPVLPIGVELWVAGVGTEVLVHRPAAVRWLGRVPNVADFYAQVDVLAVPSLEGSGVQEKAIEAIGSGKPVVATPHALRGLGPGLPSQVHVAEDARRFAVLLTELARGSARHVDLRRVQLELKLWVANRRQAYTAVLARALQAGAETRERAGAPAQAPGRTGWAG
jgi:polysaccharide biosynthesis protein PslH